MVFTRWKLNNEDKEIVSQTFGPNTLTVDEIEFSNGIGYDFAVLDIQIDQRACIEYFADKHELDDSEKELIKSAKSTKQVISLLESEEGPSEKQQLLLDEFKAMREGDATLHAIDVFLKRIPRFFYTSHFERMSGKVSLNKSEKTIKGAGVLARVAGLSDPAWLLREVAHGGRGDQGVRGPVAEISEPDLIEVMKARLAAIDWDAKKQQARARFWQQQRFIGLPRATQNRRRIIDPTITVTQDIRAADGTVIVQQGTRINPLELRSFMQAVVVLDPIDKRQMAWLAKTIPQLEKRPGVQRLTFIATRFNREHGWDAYRRVTDAVDAPVYLLTPDVAERFALAAAPSVIMAQGKRFVVEEGLR